MNAAVALGVLIFVAALTLFVLGAILVTKLQKASPPPSSIAGSNPSGLQQAPGETREAYVRRNSQRPGVVANGPTLVDLYDRINELERRLAENERQQSPPS
jgi:hypothetical protein